MTYSTKQQNQKKLLHLTKLYKERIRKDFFQPITLKAQTKPIASNAGIAYTTKIRSLSRFIHKW